jgi:hypothetical protein
VIVGLGVGFWLGSGGWITPVGVGDGVWASGAAGTVAVISGTNVVTDPASGAAARVAGGVTESAFVSETRGELTSDSHAVPRSNNNMIPAMDVCTVKFFMVGTIPVGSPAHMRLRMP